MWPIKSLKNIGTSGEEAFILLPLMVYRFLQILMRPVCVYPDKIWRVALSSIKHTLSIMMISTCKEDLNSPLTRIDQQKT